MAVMLWSELWLPVWGCFSPSSWTQQPYYVDLISLWFLALGLECQVTQLSQLTGLLGKPRNWMSLLCVSGCFAILSLSTFFFSSRIIKPCTPFWKLSLYSLFYCRLKAGALEGYQLINKLQSSHLVIKLSHWSKWNLGPWLLNGNFWRFRQCAYGMCRPICLCVFRGHHMNLGVCNTYIGRPTHTNLRILFKTLHSYFSWIFCRFIHHQPPTRILSL